MLWSTLNFVDQLQYYPSKHLKSNALEPTSEHLWKVIPIFSQYFPHIVLPQSSKQIQRSSCCGSMDARHAVTSTCMWQYAVALNVRFYPNAILSQYNVTICRGTEILSPCDNTPWTSMSDFISIFCIPIFYPNICYPNIQNLHACDNMPWISM